MNSIIVIDVGTLSLRSSVVGIDGTMRYSSSRKSRHGYRSITG